jgi:hypothetical protein
MCRKLSFDVNLVLNHQQMSESKNCHQKMLVKSDFTTLVTFGWKKSPFSVEVSTVSKATLQRMGRERGIIVWSQDTNVN